MSLSRNNSKVDLNGLTDTDEVAIKTEENEEVLVTATEELVINAEVAEEPVLEETEAEKAQEITVAAEVIQTAEASPETASEIEADVIEKQDMEDLARVEMGKKYQSLEELKDAAAKVIHAYEKKSQTELSKAPTLTPYHGAMLKQLEEAIAKEKSAHPNKDRSQELEEIKRYYNDLLKLHRVVAGPVNPQIVSAALAIKINALQEKARKETWLASTFSKDLRAITKDIDPALLQQAKSYQNLMAEYKERYGAFAVKPAAQTITPKTWSERQGNEPVKEVSLKEDQVFQNQVRLKREAVSEVKDAFGEWRKQVRKETRAENKLKAAQVGMFSELRHEVFMNQQVKSGQLANTQVVAPTLTRRVK